MYCPKCGMQMVLKEATWVCTSGQLEFSKDLGNRLAEAFAADSRPDPTPRQMQLGPMYCPGCGIAVDAAMTCRQCKKSLRRFMWALIEHHPRGDGMGGWK